MAKIDDRKTKQINPDLVVQDENSNELVLEARIKQYLNDIQKLKEKITEKKLLFESAFENDAVYVKHKESVKEAKKILQKTRSEMVKIPSISQLKSDLKKLTDEMKDLQEGLNITLQQFRNITGQTSITRDDGEVYEIIIMVKLKKKV